MSNEISLSLTLTVSNGGYSETVSQSGQFNQAAAGAVGGVAATTTSMSDLPLGSVSTLGMLFLKNLDASNACDYGYDDSGTFRAFGTIKAGEFAIMRLKTGITPALKAEAGTPAIQYLLLQN